MSKPCQTCGGPKVPGQGQRYCVDCKELAEWKAKRRHAARAVIRRHPCADCGGRKPPGYGRQICDACRDKREAAKSRRRRREHYLCRYCDTEVFEPWTNCEACKAKFAAKRQRNMPIWRARYVKKRQAAKARRARRELHRIDYRLRREREGKRPVYYQRKLRRVDNDGEYVQISAEPLLPYLEPRMAECGSTALGEVAQVNPSKLEAIVGLKASTIALGSADRLCVALGVPFGLIYGGTEL